MRVVSGIQPTGNLHLGNYLGAITRWVALQDSIADGGECLFFLADLHAISEYQDPRALAASIREMAATLIAAGIDPTRATLFRQSHVPAHPELAWLLNGTARVGWLNRMIQFKDKSGKDREGASVALYAYPVLQAADILLYRATHVPVGEDQKQHIELARDIALKFNTDFDADLFVAPEPLIGAEAARIMSLRDGRSKMSKSDPSDMSRINLTDPDDMIATKIRKAKTDPEPLPEGMKDLADRPEAANLVRIYAALDGREPASVLAEYAGRGFGTFKPALTDLVVATLAPIRDRLGALMRDPTELDRILADGAARAASLARPTMEGAYAALGLRDR